MKKALLVLSGVVVGVLGYITFDKYATPDATVIEEVMGTELYSGDFMDADPAHKAKGSFTIVADGMGGRTIMLSNDFEVANAPDPHVRINGKVIAKNNWKGGQLFAIPNFIAEDIKDVQIWCEIADISLAKSSLMMGDMMMMDDMDMGMDMKDDMDMERGDHITIEVDGKKVLDMDLDTDN